MVEAMKKLDLMVVIDPYPSATAAMCAMVRKDGVYLLPASTQFETSGSCTASNRSLQWREKVIEPLFESKPDHTLMVAFADKFGFKKELTKNYQMVKDKDGWDEPTPESILKEINRGVWTIGYTGQSPERLKLHMKNMSTFDVKSLRARGGPCDGDYFGLPWPCYGTPELKHPGSPNLYDTSKAMMDGGGCFRANFGVEREGASRCSRPTARIPKGSDLTTGYPEFDHVLLKKLGWWDELTDDEKKKAEGKNWKTDTSGGIIRVAMKVHGCHPFGNAKARAVVWNFPDGIPQHREPLYSPRPDMVAKYPTHDDKKAFWRLPTQYKTLQDKNVADKVAQEFPADPHQRPPGRIRRRRRRDPIQSVARGTAAGELRRDQSQGRERPRHRRRRIRLGQVAHRRADLGQGDGDRSRRCRGRRSSRSILPDGGRARTSWSSYPEGAAPIVRGEAVNTATTYGYDSVTMMQETKTTLCQVAKKA